MHMCVHTYTHTHTTTSLRRPMLLLPTHNNNQGQESKDTHRASSMSNSRRSLRFTTTRRPCLPVGGCCHGEGGCVTGVSKVQTWAPPLFCGRCGPHARTDRLRDDLLVVARRPRPVLRLEELHELLLVLWVGGVRKGRWSLATPLAIIIHHHQAPNGSIPFTPSLTRSSVPMSTRTRRRSSPSCCMPPNASILAACLLGCCCCCWLPLATRAAAGPKRTRSSLLHALHTQTGPKHATTGSDQPVMGVRWCGVW